LSQACKSNVKILKSNPYSVQIINLFFKVFTENYIYQVSSFIPFAENIENKWNEFKEDLNFASWKK